jgi:hypothetical protein
VAGGPARRLAGRWPHSPQRGCGLIIDEATAGLVRAAGFRRPWWVWAAPFAAVAGVLLVRNAFIFGTPLHEDADMGANSILIEQARRFTLLVGHYSRDKFHHPGPAFLYVQSWGESLFWSALHLVPAAWNGQLIAVYALNALFAALVAGTGYGLTGSVRTAAACCAAVLALAAVRPAVFSSDWMPYMLVPAYLGYLVAIASVAAGNLRDAWIAALTGWFLINGNVAFLLFVPLAACACLVTLAWPHRRSLPAAARSFAARRRRVWVPVAGISAVLAFPIAANTVLHWPGEFGRYLAYSPSSSAQAAQGLRQVAHWVLWFWWPGSGRVAWLVPVAAYAVAGAATWRLAPGPVRRFCVCLLAFNTLSSAAFVAYAATAVDELTPGGYYIGYFYWSAPAIMLLVTVVAVAESLPALPGAAVAAAAGAVACAAFAVAPQTVTSIHHTDPGNLATGPDTDPALPAGVARMAALAGGRPVVLRLAHPAWPELTGLLVQAERTGVRACVADPGWEFMVTSQFICTPAELADGAAYHLYVPGAVPRGRQVVFRLGRALVTVTAK